MYNGNHIYTKVKLFLHVVLGFCDHNPVCGHLILYPVFNSDLAFQTSSRIPSKTIFDIPHPASILSHIPHPANPMLNPLDWETKIEIWPIQRAVVVRPFLKKYWEIRKKSSLCLKKAGNLISFIIP